MYNSKEREELSAMETELMNEARKADSSYEEKILADELDAQIKEMDSIVKIETTDNTAEISDSQETSDSDAESSEKDVSESEAEEKSANEATDTKEEAEESKEVSEKDADKEETAEEKKLSKKEKEKQRLDKSWKNLEAQKQEIAKEKEEIQRLKDEANKVKAEAEEKAKAEKPKKPTSQDYENLAKWYDDNGEYDKADLAKEAAKNQRNAEFQELQTLKRNTVEAQTAFKNEWSKTVDSVLARPENKDLQDTSTAFSKKVSEIISKDPRISQFADGFEIAVHIAKGELAVASLADKDKQIAELETKLKDLNKKTQLSSSGANQRNGETGKPRYKSLDDEFSQMLKEAKLADARGGL